MRAVRVSHATINFLDADELSECWKRLLDSPKSLVGRPAIFGLLDVMATPPATTDVARARWELERA